MKQIIRKNTFETNSSSMHSLVVVKDPKPYSQSEYDTFNTYIGNKSFDLFRYDEGSYERFPFRVLRTPLDKLRYYVAHYIGFLNKKELIPKVIDFIHEHTGIEKSKINIKAYNRYDSEYEEYGYAGINDSGEDVFTYVERHNISMEEFVLNPKYVVIVDGDEYQEFKKLFESNILDANNFEDISSGASFWNDDIYEISLYWFDRNEYNLLAHISDVNKFIKQVRFGIWGDCFNVYKEYFEEIKTFLEEVKKNFPNIMTSICCTRDIYDKVKQEDISIFEYIEIRDTTYGEPKETIKLLD